MEDSYHITVADKKYEFKRLGKYTEILLEDNLLFILPTGLPTYQEIEFSIIAYNQGFKDGITIGQKEIK